MRGRGGRSGPEIQEEFYRVIWLDMKYLLTTLLNWWIFFMRLNIGTDEPLTITFIDVKSFHNWGHLNLRDRLPELTEWIGGILKWLLVLLIRFMLVVWVSLLKVNKFMRSLGKRSLQNSYASFSCWISMTSRTLVKFNSFRAGPGSLLKFKKVRILAHFSWSFSILDTLVSEVKPQTVEP